MRPGYTPAMKARRVARILLKVAAALAAGFVVSVGVAWGPLLVGGWAASPAACSMDSILTYASGRAALHAPLRVAESAASTDDRAVIAIRRSGVRVYCMVFYGATACEAESAIQALDPRGWVVQSSDLKRDGVLRVSPPVWMKLGWPPAWSGASESESGVGWPWVVVFARGEPSRDSTDDDLWRRGWLGIGEQPLQGYRRAVPVRVYMRGAVLSSLFYGAMLFAIVEGAVRMRRRLRAWRGRCGACGYDLAGNIGGRCPECGGDGGTR